MSYNPGVTYAGPDGATRSVTDELTARFGAPDRPYEFVTGWKSPDNVSGHNPDSNGITHGVDIFMTPERNRWAADHLAARGRAGDPRVFYVIYADQIASPSTGYEFSGSGWGHWDHPHLSVWDGYWGGPCTLPASIYNDTSSWGIAPLAGQGSGITPIQEDDMAFTAEQEAFIVKALTSLVENVATKDTIKDQTTELPGKVWSYKNPGLGGADAYQILRDALSSSKKLVTEVAALAAKAAVGGATVAQIEQAVKDGLAAGIHVDATVTVAGGDQ